MFPNNVWIAIVFVIVFVIALIIDSLIDLRSDMQNKTKPQSKINGNAFNDQKFGLISFSDDTLERFMKGSHFGSSFNLLNYARKNRVPINMAWDHFRQRLIHFING